MDLISIDLALAESNLIIQPWKLFYTMKSMNGSAHERR